MRPLDREMDGANRRRTDLAAKPSYLLEGGGGGGKRKFALVKVNPVNRLNGTSHPEAADNSKREENFMPLPASPF